MLALFCLSQNFYIMRMCKTENINKTIMVEFFGINMN